MISRSFGCRSPLRVQRSLTCRQQREDSADCCDSSTDASCIQIPQWLMAAAIPWLGQPALAAELSEGGYSKGSYYVTLGLFAVTLPGRRCTRE